MQPPSGWQNPIRVPPGQWQYGVDPLQLLSGRRDLIQWRLDLQQGLLNTNTPREDPIVVTADGVIWDGHHAIRIAAETGRTVDVFVTDKSRIPRAVSILALPVV